MIIIDPQQELFSAIKLSLEAKGYDVYDGFLPGKDASYPFIYLGDSQQIDEANKSAVFGTVYQTIHIYSNTPKNRGTVSDMLLKVKQTLREIRKTANFSWWVIDLNQQIIPDNTTATPLLHGVISATIKFS